jgi:hypothetical protein
MKRSIQLSFQTLGNNATIIQPSTHSNGSFHLCESLSLKTFPKRFVFLPTETLANPAKAAPGYVALVWLHMNLSWCDEHHES